MAESTRMCLSGRAPSTAHRYCVRSTPAALSPCALRSSSSLAADRSSASTAAFSRAWRSACAQASAVLGAQLGAGAGAVKR